MLSNSPTPANDVTIPDPPELTKGNAIPVKGSKPVTTPTLINA
jgi:hypothetical protein